MGGHEDHGPRFDQRECPVQVQLPHAVTSDRRAMLACSMLPVNVNMTAHRGRSAGAGSGTSLLLDPETKGDFRFPTDSPTAIARMLDFCARHGIEPVVEIFPMSQVNEALD